MEKLNFSSQPYGLLAEARRLLPLSCFLFLSILPGTMAMLCDTVICGWNSTEDLAALGASVTLWIPWCYLIQGVLSNTVPLIARLRGENPLRVRELFWQSLWIALLLSLATLGLIPAQKYLINHLTQAEAGAGAKALRYLWSLQWGCPGLYVFYCSKALSDGYAHALPGVLIGFMGLGLKIVLNCVLAYGHFGAPKLGLEGCGWASTASYWLMAFAAFGWLWKDRARYRKGAGSNFFSPAPPDPKTIWKLMKRGLTTGAAQSLESAAFTVIGYLLLWRGSETASSAHQILSSLSGCIYLLPTAVGWATTIQLGEQLGLQTGAERAQKVQRAGLLLGATGASLAALGAWGFGRPLLSLCSQDPAVLEQAQAALGLCALYQLPDAIQVVCSSVFKAHQDLLPQLLINLLCYWSIAVPIGTATLLYASTPPLGQAREVWLGLLVGVWFAAVISLIWLRFQIRKKQVQLHAPVPQAPASPKARLGWSFGVTGRSLLRSRGPRAHGLKIFSVQPERPTTPASNSSAHSVKTTFF